MNEVLPLCWLGMAVTTAALYLRPKPASTFAALLLMPAGTQLDVWGRVGDWWHVQMPDGLTGYAHGDYLKGTVQWP